MRVLVACEFSDTVCKAFRALGHDAWSCDLLPSDGNSPYHIHGDVLNVLDDGWDLMIAHPPCQFLTVTGNKWFLPAYKDRFPDRLNQREDALQFVVALMNAPIPRIAIENPIGVIGTRIRKPDQIIQPYEFGHPDRKSTCLWLKGLPLLKTTNVVTPIIVTNRNGKTASAHHDAALRLPPEERWKVRSKTYQGIASAMAAQWGQSESYPLQLQMFA